jgi:protein-S-isoprenylcysteine O-methyltransferase Ste14
VAPEASRLRLAMLRLLGGVVTVAPFVTFHIAAAVLMVSQRPATLVAVVYALLSLLIGTMTALVAPAAAARCPEIRLALWALRRLRLADDETIGDHYRVWALKLFFIPFLAAALPGNTEAFESMLTAYRERNSWPALILLGHQFFYLLDVTVGLIGYVLTMRWLGSEVRSANPYREAWLFCLICYPPFWNPIRAYLLAFDTSGLRWDEYLGDSVLVYVWGVMLVLLEGLYVWATVIFGIRFSNLTNRGILTTGPYRLLKHPAYVSKNLSWWLWYLPFIPVRGVEVAVIDCLQLGILNWIYYMRAKTEEQHLRDDPAYREYESWMASRSWWRRLVNRPR